MRRYGEWAGNPKGKTEDVTRCVATVWQGMISKQCSHKRGHGIDSLYCRQHAKRHPVRTELGGADG